MPGSFVYALKITINQEPAVIAGADNLDVLNAMLTCKGQLGDGLDAGRFISVVLGGLTLATLDAPGQHLRWIEERPLRLGDVVKFEMAEDVPVHPVAGNDARSAENAQHMADLHARHIFENCKQTYFALRDKYEAE